MTTTRSPEDAALLLQNLKADLESLMNRYNANPSKLALARIEAVRAEIRDLATRAG